MANDLSSSSHSLLLARAFFPFLMFPFSGDSYPVSLCAKLWYEMKYNLLSTTLHFITFFFWCRINVDFGCGEKKNYHNRKDTLDSEEKKIGSLFSAVRLWSCHVVAKLIKDIKIILYFIALWYLSANDDVSCGMIWKVRVKRSARIARFSLSKVTKKHIKSKHILESTYVKDFHFHC